MGRKRKSRRDLPERVYHKHGAYFFVEPNGKWNKLEKTLPEALAEYGKMIEPENLNTMGQIMDRYLAEVVPEKAATTQESQTRYIRRLREVFGYMKPDEIKPKDIYRYRDIRQNKNGKATANKEKETLGSIFSKAIEWGITEKNPCKVVKGFPSEDDLQKLDKKRSRRGQIWAVIFSLSTLVGVVVLLVLLLSIISDSFGYAAVVNEYDPEQLVSWVYEQETAASPNTTISEDEVELADLSDTQLIAIANEYLSKGRVRALNAQEPLEHR